MTTTILKLGAIFYNLLIIVVCLYPLPPSEGGIPHLDKLIHAIIYFVHTALHFQVLPRRWVLPFSLAWGVLIELLQIMTPSRSFEWGDIGANTLGAFAGYFIARKFADRQRSNRQAP